jgi:hypothetical protein
VAPAGLQLGLDWAIHRSQAEQSNTSICISRGAILKVTRKLEEAATPAMLVWVELEGVLGAGAATLSVLQAFVRNQGDGWPWVLERLSADAADEATAWLRRLDQRTAEMHAAFAIQTQDSAFRPEPAGAADRQGWVGQRRLWPDARWTRRGLPGKGLSLRRANLRRPCSPIAARCWNGLGRRSRTRRDLQGYGTTVTTINGDPGHFVECLLQHEEALGDLGDGGVAGLSRFLSGCCGGKQLRLHFSIEVVPTPAVHRMPFGTELQPDCRPQRRAGLRWNNHEFLRFCQKLAAAGRWVGKQVTS